MEFISANNFLSLWDLKDWANQNHKEFNKKIAKYKVNETEEKKCFLTNFTSEYKFENHGTFFQNYFAVFGNYNAWNPLYENVIDSIMVTNKY